jgi:hypothetical protein
MMNFISKVIDQFSSLFKQLQIERVISVFIIGIIFLTSNVDSSVMSKQTATKKIDKMLQQDRDPNRPKTTAQWQQQAKEVEGKPGERIKRIGEQSADALKEFGSMYPDVAKNSAEELKNRTNK